MNPIRPGTPDCPWPPMIVWNSYSVIKPTEDGRYIVTNGNTSAYAYFKDGDWFRLPFENIVGWRLP